MITTSQSRLLARKIRRLVDAELNNTVAGRAQDPNYQEQVKLELKNARDDLAKYIGKLRTPT